MALLLQLVKWTDEGAGGVLREGFQARADTAQGRVASIGGTVKAMGYIADGDWHAAVLVEFDDYQPGLGVQSLYQQTASGAIDEIRNIWLVDPAEVEAAQAYEYRAPGEP